MRGEQLQLHFGQSVAVIPQPGGGVLVRAVERKIVAEAGIREAAKVLRLPRRTVQSWIVQGKIPAVKLGEAKNSKYRVNMVAVYRLRQAMDEKLAMLA